ncbi:N-acetylmuramoyl-L-alanine amidase family protein [Rhizosphaericola mali]|uniref:N-acetylmuramoyl-L-alanine amidase n=1 Tax=Rhizosphaericola mali TaxID=2545455 RepID=A0A5P2G437_9BACT|nr:N-acetylmuramoyl-L-alanine amidase [Rhizosphaericola mali]QES87863.1 N-acetylmuramoyl-L-alanine amidase [Rhizosphaericola mali]
MITQFRLKKSQQVLNIILLAFFIIFYSYTQAQQSIWQFEYPEKDTIYTDNTSIFFGGNVKKDGKLFIQGENVKIYKTGSFLYQFKTQPKNINSITAQFIIEKDTFSRTFYIFPQKTKLPKAIAKGDVKIVQITPAEAEWLQPGNILTITAEADKNSDLYFFNAKVKLKKISVSNSIATYHGLYKINESDTNNIKLLTGFNILNGNKISFSAPSTLKIKSTSEIILGKTIGNYAYMMYGDGDDRLGGAKMSYLDTGINVQIIGKYNGLYKVALSPNHSAFIPVDHIQIQNTNTEYPESLSANINVTPNSNFDQIKINLDKKLPYSSTTELDGNKLKILIYGATSNTNWITQLENLQSIKNIYYEQTENNVLTININLKTAINWGYDIHYDQNNLIIQVNHAPKSNKLKDLVVGIDAGHGGSNLGANGLSGVLEKDITLQVAMRLEKKLRKLGITTIMTRTTDTTLSMTDRIDYLKSAHPNMVISIHCNSASPLVKGNSTYYRYISFRPLSQYLHSEMLALGLDNYGNIGSFNFGLNGPTQFINALNELAFISNPEEEEKLTNPNFQDKMADAMAKAIKHFFKDFTSEKNN